MDLQPQVGWYVGYLERGGNAYFFAINMDINKPDDAKARINITKSILGDMRLIPRQTTQLTLKETAMHG